MPRRRKVPVEEQESEVTFKKPSKKPTSSEKPSKKQKNEPEWLQGDGMNISQLILSVQKTDCNNTKVTKELTKLYDKMGHKAFMTVFMKLVSLYLIRDENDEYAPRMMKFFGTFVASFGEAVNEDGGSHLIVQRVFKEILAMTSKLFYVRARICLLITYIMSSFSQKAEIDEPIMDEVIHRMIGTFIKDISPVVRQNAIMALQRLQDPENPEDQVTRAYLYHMESDPVSKVRQAAITAIAKKLPAFPHIIDRLHDSDDKVRRHTYFQMASVPVKSYKIADRIEILSAGLYDRSDIVKRTVHNIVIPNWIAAYENNYTDFIKAIKLDSNDNELLKFRSLAQDALNAIFNKHKISELVAFLNLLEPENEYRNCLSIEKTNSLECLIVWKVIIKFHQDYTEGKHKNDGEGDEMSEEEQNETITNAVIFPELSVFCDYIEKFMDEFKVTPGSEAKYQMLNFSHCLIVLLEIAQLNDLGDEIGRKRLQEVLKKILIEHDVSEHVIKEIAHVIELIITDRDARLKIFNDIVADMLNLGSSSEYSRQSIIEDLISKVDIDIKVKANSLKMEMMELKEQESLFVERKHYGEAQKVSEKYTQLNEELIELLRPYAASDSTTNTLVNSLSSDVVAKKITPSAVLKNLRICYYAITMKGVKSLTPEILKTYNNFVRYHLESADIVTRIWALKTATAYSLLYESLSKDVYVILKSQMFKSNNIVIWETAIGCIVDLLLRYSIEKMDSVDANQENNASSSNPNRGKKGGRTLYTDDGDEPEEMDIMRSIDIIQMLTHVLDNNVDQKVHKATLTGLCKLILHGQYCTRDLMSKFLIAYFNPATDAQVNQILGIFFESIVKLKKQESLQEALVPTLVTLLEAPYDSPLHEVKQETVIKYVIGATRPIFCSNGLNLHNTLALKLIELLKDNPQNKEIIKVFSKEFLTLEISEDPLLKMDMAGHIESLLKNITPDARTLKNITDFRDMLKGTYKPSLKFSSTAMSHNVAVDEDAGIPEEAEDDENERSVKATERVSPIRDVMDISNDSVQGEPSRATEASKSSVESPDRSTKKDGENIPEEVSEVNTSEINETHPSINDMSVPLSQSVNIPATQEEEIDSSSADEIDDTVIESSVVQDIELPETDEDIELPATPEPDTSSRGMKTHKFKRQLELSLSVNSPLRKNPRNSNTPKPVTASPSTRSKTAISQTLNSPKTPRRLKKASASSPKTPINNASTLASPRRSRFSTLSHTDSSTPSTERQTRQQSKSEVSQNTKVTRSATKKIIVDQKIITEKAQVKVSSIGKIIKKATLPVPTKTSGLRTTRARGPASNQTSDQSIEKEKQLADLATGRPIRKISAVRHQTVAAKGKKDVKQRPRWN